MGKKISCEHAAAWLPSAGAAASRAACSDARAGAGQTGNNKPKREGANKRTTIQAFTRTTSMSGHVRSTSTRNTNSNHVGRDVWAPRRRSVKEPHHNSEGNF